MTVTAFQGSDYGDWYESRSVHVHASGQKTSNKSTENSFNSFMDVFGTGRDESGQKIENPASHPAKSAGIPPAPFSFWDFVDIINPLQHIPVVSAIYRHLTGDEIRDVARIAGDALYGGPAGLALGVAEVAFKNATGKDAGETVMAMLTGDETPAAAAAPTPTPETMLAQNMDAVTPASGDAMDSAPVVLGQDIIWDDAPPKDISRFLPPVSTPTEPERNRQAGNHADGMHSRNQAVPSVEKGTAFAPSMMMASGLADSPLFLQTQATPAVSAEEPDLPPALIAARMMEALDKYGAMKRQGL